MSRILFRVVDKLAPASSICFWKCARSSGQRLPMAPARSSSSSECPRVSFCPSATKAGVAPLPIAREDIQGWRPHRLLLPPLSRLLTESRSSTGVRRVRSCCICHRAVPARFVPPGPPTLLGRSNGASLATAPSTRGWDTERHVFVSCCRG